MPPLPKDVIRALSGAASGLTARDDDPAIGERHLLVDSVRLVVPTRGLELRNDVLAAGVCFVEWHASRPLREKMLAQ